MRYRRYLAVLSALLISGVAVLVFAPTKRELIVRGKPVSEWALALAGPAPTEPAQEVFKSIGPEAVPDLVRLLRTGDSLFARPINALAGKLPNRLDGKLRRIFKLDESIRRRYTAAKALWLMGTNGTRAVPVLLDALRDRNTAVSVTAALGLARIGPASLPGLILALDDRSALVREAAMTGLSYSSSDAGGAVPKLVVLLRQPADRPHARAALQAIGKPAVPALIELLNQPPDEVRNAAIEILGSIGVTARAAIPALLKLAENPSRSVRYSTINSLGLICRRCDPVVSVLQNALEDESWEIRRLAATHLSAEQRAAERTVDTLLRKLEETTPAEKQRAISNLGLMGASAARAVPSLQALANGGERKERELAREALEQITAAQQKGEEHF